MTDAVVEPESGARFYVAEVERLPWPHGLFRCAHKGLFDAAVEDIAPDRPEDAQPLVSAVAHGLSDAQLGRCPYHRPDWSAACALAVQCWSRRPDGDLDQIEEMVASADLPEETRQAALSFFFDPIFLDGDLLGNGQHRMCAMKLAGVERCLVER